MRLRPAFLIVIFLTLIPRVLAIYTPLHEYRGATFFDGWDYWGNVDNTTWGNVTYVGHADAKARQLTYVNPVGNAIVRVDNSTTIANVSLVNRLSVRMTSQYSYGVGTLWIIDAVHLPYGCSVWPSFWSLGANKEWPYAGEIDIIEGINLMGNNQMALHTTPGCVQASNNGQTGNTIKNDCSVPQGCVVAETKPNSYGQGFSQAGGGVWALQFDISGIYIWFWSRLSIPQSIQTATSQSTLDTATFGSPSASYPASGCNITEYFGPQKMIISITLCGVWAGVPNIYSQTCPGNCIYNNIIGPGSPTYDNAYFEIPYIRIYNLDKLPMSSNLHTGPNTPSTVSLGTAVTVVTETATPTVKVPTSSGFCKLPEDFSILLLRTAAVGLAAIISEIL